VYLPYNVHNNNQLYQPIDKSNLLAFYMHYLGCIVLKQGRKDGITNFSARDHVDDTVVTGEPAAPCCGCCCKYILYVWLSELSRTQNKYHWGYAEGISDFLLF